MRNFTKTSWGHTPISSLLMMVVICTAVKHSAQQSKHSTNDTAHPTIHYQNYLQKVHDSSQKDNRSTTRSSSLCRTRTQHFMKSDLCVRRWLRSYWAHIFL